MKALSLWQPHATAIALGLKPWETRSWPTHYRGPLAIHAAKRPWSDQSEWDTEARRRLGVYIASHGPTPWVLGGVVCICDLVECVRTSELRGCLNAAHAFWGDFTDGEDGKGRWAFRLENVQVITPAVPWRGMQGFFEVELGAIEQSPRIQAQQNLFGGD